MSDHSFNPFIAKKYNINIAIILNSFVFWTRTNAAKEENFHEDRFWCFGTPEYFSKYFPYFTAKQIKYALQQAIEFDLLIKSNFNKKGFDRTGWYSLSDKALTEFNLDKTCLKPSCHSTNLDNEYQQGLYEENSIQTQASPHLTNLDNASDKFVLTIPITKPVTKQDNKNIRASAVSPHEYQDTLYPKPTKQTSLTITHENPHQIPDELIDEWRQIRKAKRAPITITVWKRLNAELSKHSGGPIEAFEEMISRGWSTFKCDWINNKNKTRKIDYNSTSW